MSLPSECSWWRKEQSVFVLVFLQKTAAEGAAAAQAHQCPYRSFWGKKLNVNSVNWSKTNAEDGASSHQISLEGVGYCRKTILTDCSVLFWRTANLRICQNFYFILKALSQLLIIHLILDLLFLFHPFFTRLSKRWKVSLLSRFQYSLSLGFVTFSSLNCV